MEYALIAFIVVGSGILTSTKGLALLGIAGIIIAVFSRRHWDIGVLLAIISLIVYFGFHHNKGEGKGSAHFEHRTQEMRTVLKS